MTMCNVRSIAPSHEPPENYQLNLQLPLALQSFIVSFSSLLICLASTLLFWFSLTALILLFLEKRMYKATVHNPLTSKLQADTVKN